ncbi:MAG: hypothetical protein HY791_25065 [Deltaproteobacteria bacterium]|nr:hypothetical protein [Deltaproteobacteria bacterium]
MTRGRRQARPRIFELDAADPLLLAELRREHRARHQWVIDRNGTRGNNPFSAGRSDSRELDVLGSTLDARVFLATLPDAHVGGIVALYSNRSA